MKKEEALEVLRTINEMYPRFNLTKRKAKVLVPNLMQMDYQGVMKNLSAYIMEHPYPPMLSEIAAYLDVEDSHLEEMEKWQEEAKKVSPKVKEQFQEQFEQLIKAKGR
ncbi:hypothetical protein CIL05_20090 [Virgibacillus profundi]|uniref:Replicative helicase inhibitor G39P N-terminal domain-containing protein n=1 Tax=Virgibacillus profundi TaxID=2024555 RepID=A0A2A2I6Z6_9BACI|nr:hypothetical protein [Virgibacillus profundi]PAV27781.1 hypothetical protein CIL05_20090 [Virgibacillus profundi]PXY52003.1 hypothetical protein CIT14_20070 [Virgibacillus profundi]